MLLGINITLFGCIMAVDPHSKISELRYIIAFIGLIISVVGLVKKDQVD